MSRYLGMALAGALLGAACGCSLDAFLSPTFCVYGPKTVANGSLSQVAAKLQDGLSDAGIVMLPTKRVGADVRIAGVKNSQKAFCLHLSAIKDVGSTKTQVRMQWDRGGDEELWQLVLKILATPAPGSDDDASAGLSLKDEE